MSNNEREFWQTLREGAGLDPESTPPADPLLTTEQVITAQLTKLEDAAAQSKDDGTRNAIRNATTVIAYYLKSQSPPPSASVEQADVSLRYSIDPENPDKVLKLNAYGRACYRAGEANARCAGSVRRPTRC